MSQRPGRLRSRTNGWLRMPDKEPFMSTLSFIESNDTHTTAHARIGFELGWDYAHYRVTPPAP